MSTSTNAVSKELKLATNMSRILDDDFEEFPTEAWSVSENPNLQQDDMVNDWDDDHVDDMFIDQLRAELNK